MSTSRRVLRIVVNNHSYTRQDFEDIQKWENEGGNTEMMPNTLSTVVKPLHPGEVFEVIGSSLKFENGSLYYDIEVELLALH
jgi:hypothetical protein